MQFLQTHAELRVMLGRASVNKMTETTKFSAVFEAGGVKRQLEINFANF